MARVPNVIGSVHLELFDLDEALRLTLEGDEVAQQLSRTEPRGHALVKAGLAHLYRGGSTVRPRRASAVPKRCWRKREATVMPSARRVSRSQSHVHGSPAGFPRLTARPSVPQKPERR